MRPEVGWQVQVLTDLFGKAIMVMFILLLLLMLFLLLLCELLVSVVIIANIFTLNIDLTKE